MHLVHVSSEQDMCSHLQTFFGVCGETIQIVVVAVLADRCAILDFLKVDLVVRVGRYALGRSGFERCMSVVSHN